jgi:predicted nucleic acid-binding protein
LRQWFDQNEKLCYISAISPFEMAFGALRLAMRKSEEDHLRAHRISIISKFFLLKIAPRTIEIDATILARAAGLRALAERTYGDIGTCDAIIAASADIGRHVLVTMNVRQLAATGVNVIDAVDLFGGRKGGADHVLSAPFRPLVVVAAR